jgi:hypothetical protein
MPAQRRISFLVVCILAFYGEIFGQKNTPTGAGFSEFVSIPSYPAPFKPKFDHFEWVPSHCWAWYGKPCPPPPYFKLLSLPPSGYISSLGFICKKELQLDKISPIRFRFRLGSVDYVNWLEQKPNAKRY